MADTFSNDLRLRLQESGSNASTWGTLLNGTITNIASALGQGSEAIPNASTHTITLADGTADEARSLYLKCTGGGQACTVTLAPNTISKVWIIDNTTSYTLTFSQGSGANVAIAAGAVKVIATDGAGSGAAVVDTLAGLEGSLSTLAVTGVLTTTAATVFNGGFASNASSTITTADNLSVLSLISTDADENSGPTLSLFRNSANPADNDFAGVIAFNSENSADESIRMGMIRSQVLDVTDGTEDSKLAFYSREGGVEVETIALVSGSITTPTAGTSNFRAGVNAGNSIASGGNSNTVVGDEAGTAITTGDENVAVGTQSLDNSDVGRFNTAIGKSALGGDQKGSKNTAVGNSALQTQNFTSATDSFNTAVGFNAGGGITTGVNNSLIGSLAGDALTDADANVAVGYLALSGDTKGSKSVAIGQQALSTQNFTSPNDTHNIAIGYQTGLSVTTGEFNTLIGGLAGTAMTTGAGNTAVGIQAMGGGVVTGGSNTVIGSTAGFALTSGGNNLCLGKDSGRTGSPGGNLTAQNNQIVIGDENITNIYAQVAVQDASDARDKTDFTALDLGLDFVKALAPVTYKWDKRSKYGDKTADGYDLNDQTPDGTHKEDWLDIGFKAQEVEALEIAAGYNKSNKTNLLTELSGDGKQYSLTYSKFIPILVKAIQEQSALITALTARITTLEG